MSAWAIMLDRPAARSTVAGRKRLELARALATEPKLLLLDEVLAGLNPSEIRDIVPVIRALCGARHHDRDDRAVMQAVMSLAEHVFVLAEGRVIAQGTPAQVAADRRWSRPISATAPRPEAGGAHARLSPARRATTCTPATARPRCCAASISTVDAGEIVAVLGSNGVGQVDTQPRDLRHRARRVRGAIRFDGAAIERARSRRPSSRAGLSTCRKAGASFPTCRCATISISAAIAAPRARRAQNRERVFAIFPRLHERRAQRAGTLSGGEQQMLAIGRGLMAEPKLLILDEPSLGLSPLLVEELFALDQAHQCRRRVRAAGRAERHAEPRSRQPRLHSRRRKIRHVRQRRGHRRRSRAQARLSWNVTHDRCTPYAPVSPARRSCRARRL